MKTTYRADFASHVKARLHELKPAERQVAELMLAQLDDVLFLTAIELGEAAGTSDATVIRTAKALGYSGLPELRRHLGQSRSSQTAPTTRLNTALRRISSGLAPAERVVADSLEQVEETQRQLEQADLDKAATALLDAKAVFTWGQGLSGVAAEYAALRLARRGLLVRHCAASGFRLADELLPLTGSDAVLLYAPGRHNRDLETIVTHAERTGAPVVLVTSKLAFALAERALVTLPAPMSPAKVTGELLTASIVTDALLLTITARTPQRSAGTNDLLSRLRRDLGERPRTTRRIPDGKSGSAKTN